MNLPSELTYYKRAIEKGIHFRKELGSDPKITLQLEILLKCADAMVNGLQAEEREKEKKLRA